MYTVEVKLKYGGSQMRRAKELISPGRRDLLVLDDRKGEGSKEGDTAQKITSSDALHRTPYNYNRRWRNYRVRSSILIEIRVLLL